jgi:hypothetical protein
MAAHLVRFAIDSPMIRIPISLAAYQAIASTMPEGRTARPPEPLEVGEGAACEHSCVGLWIDHITLAALRRERGVHEDWSEVILRLCATPIGEP